MALRWLNPWRLMRKNAQSVLGMVCLLAWFVPFESWAQGSLWDDVKAAAKQAVRDKIKSVPETIPNTLPSQQPAQTPITTSANAQSLTEDRIDYDKINDFSGQINPTVFKNETVEMHQSATRSVLILHPFHVAPAFIEKTVTVDSVNTSLEFSVRGHARGDFLARVVAVSQSGQQNVLYEKTIVGSRGWYAESIDLGQYRGQSVTLRFEVHATGWSFEYAGLDYFFVRGDGSRAAYNSNGISSSGEVAPEIIKQSEQCSLPRTFADTKKNFPVCVNTPTESLVRKNGCYQGSDQYNAKARQFALLALKSADSCVTYPYRGDFYDVFGNAVHAGIDLRANNVPVYAISSGTVDESIFDTKEQRSTLIIQNADKRQKTLYLHMSEILPQKGEYVNRGEKVGIAGGIGAMSPHLHVEVWTADSPNYQKERAITGNSSCGGRCKDSDIAILTADPFIVLNTNLDSGVISTSSGLSGDAATPLGDFPGKWKAQGGKDLLVISPQKIISTFWRKNDAGKPEKYTGEARWSNLDSDSNEEETFGLSKKRTTLAEISKRYQMALKGYKKDPSDFGMSDPKLSRKAIQAMRPGPYQVMWSYFGGESGEEYIVDKDHMLKIKDDPYGFSVTLYDRVK